MTILFIIRIFRKKNEKNYLDIKLKEKNKDNKINKIYLENENFE